jgi:hypothetical protein
MRKCLHCIIMDEILRRRDGEDFDALDIVVKISAALGEFIGSNAHAPTREDVLRSVLEELPRLVDERVAHLLETNAEFAEEALKDATKH